MASLLRCGHSLNAPLANVRRQMVQFNQMKCILSPNNYDKLQINRCFHENNHSRGDSFSWSTVGLISAGCASVAIYNWKR